MQSLPEREAQLHVRLYQYDFRFQPNTCTWYYISQYNQKLYKPNIDITGFIKKGINNYSHPIRVHVEMIKKGGLREQINLYL